jgi:AraC family ethanolamine operon transcriptional activator
LTSNVRHHNPALQPAQRGRDNLEREPINPSIPCAPSRTRRFSAATREATDAWRHSHSATDWSRLFIQLQGRPFVGRIREVWLGPVQVIHEQVGHAFACQGRAWKKSRVFRVYLSGTIGSLYLGGRPLATNVLVTHPWDCADRFLSNGSLECILIAVDDDFFSGYAQRALGYRLFSDVHGAPVLNSDSAMVARFRVGVLNLLHNVQQEPHLLLHDHSRVALQDHLLTLLLEALDPKAHCIDRLPQPSPRANIVARAIDFMEARLAQPIVAADISDALRVSPRTLRYSFEAIAGVSPTHYLLARRLNGARRDLSRSGPAGTVEEVALRWGFGHMGRFAQYYRLTFGECPSDTCRRLQDLCPAARPRQAAA